MQYRAIGLVMGRYIPSDEQLNCGRLVTPEGQEIAAVLLGRVVSLVKNHLSLTEEHLWVVYPRTQEVKSKKPRRASEEAPPPELRLQIVGIWEPETLHRVLEEEALGESLAILEEEETSEDDMSQGSALVGEEEQDTTLMPLTKPVRTMEELEDESTPKTEDGYFSVRGEIIYHVADKNRIIVKIQQLNRKNPKQRRDFKLHLFGTIEHERVLHHFWDLQVQRQGERLMITAAQCVGAMPPQRRSKKPNGSGGGGRKPFKRRSPGSPSSPSPSTETRPPRSVSGGAPRPKPSLSKPSDLG
jgi:hypothetical protein